MNNNQVVLLSNVSTGFATMNVDLTNITVTDASGNPMPNYTVVVVDGQSTLSFGVQFESLPYFSNGALFA